MPQNKHLYALADCNNFFVSCERIFRPDLRNKPVVVLSGNDGCVIARSNEVKQLDIKMGVPFYQIQELVKRYDIVHFSSNFALYGDISSRIMKILSKYTSDLQQYSIDEAFIDLSHIQSTQQARLLCLQIRQEILQGVGVPVSFGIAYTKTLCKIASHYAKKYAGYKGACLIDSEEKRLKALAQYPLDEVWGIGRQAIKKLNSLGQHSALDFAQSNPYIAQRLLHLPGLNTWRELNGEDCISVREIPQKKSIMRSRTFAHGVTDRLLIEQAMSNFCNACATKLRQQKSVCKQLVVFANTSRFNEQKGTIYGVITLSVGTNDSILLTHLTLKIIRQQWQANTPYKRAGVLLTDIQTEEGVQQNLFEQRNYQKERNLQKAIDKVNSIYGKNTISLVPQMHTKEIEKLLDVGKRSPAYTTSIKDIITLHC